VCTSHGEASADTKGLSMDVVRAPLRVGVIGAGVMGAAHARVVTQSHRTELAFVVDTDRDRAADVADRFGTECRQDIDDFDHCDAVIIAAPTEHHWDWAKRVLDADVPVLIEKPLSDQVSKARKLIEVASNNGVPLMCGFLERYNSAFIALREIVGQPLFLTAERISPYPARIRTGVASDLMIHDLDMTMLLMGRGPETMQAHFAYCHPSSDSDSEDVAQTVLTFSDGVFASLCASRLGQRKVRGLTVVELDRLIEIDLLRNDITVYRHVANDAIDDGPGYRQQTVIDIPFVPRTEEPLVAQLDRFVDLATGRADPALELDTLLAPHELVAEARERAQVARMLAA
jgi:predicted dehydrogenase